MNTVAEFENRGQLERLADSTAFAVLFGTASIVIAPSVLLGIAMLPRFVFGEPNPALGGNLGLLLPYGGLLGYIGLFRARRLPTSNADYWATLVCLGIGIATAAAVGGGLIAIGDGGDLFSAGATAVLSVPIVAALGRIARLRRLRALDQGRVRDSLPLIFLALACAEAACAIAIGTQLAIAG